MSTGLTEYELIVASESRKVTEKGRTTLPKEWREKHGVEEGDEVAMKKCDDGRLEVLPPGYGQDSSC